MTVLRSLPAPAEALLGSNALAHVVTRNADGSPQVSVVWCAAKGDDGLRRRRAAQGDQVMFVTERSSTKVKNLERDPSVVLSVEDEEFNQRGAQQHLLIHGRASVLPGPVSKDLCDELCRVYVGRADHPLNLSRSPTAVTVAVDVERIAGNGPWTAAGTT